MTATREDAEKVLRWLLQPQNVNEWAIILWLAEQQMPPELRPTGKRRSGIHTCPTCRCKS